MMRASFDEHRGPDPATYRVVARLIASLVAAALLAAFLTLGIGNRIVDEPDAEHHHAALTAVDILDAVLPAPLALAAVVTASMVVLLAAVTAEPLLATERRGRAPPREIDA